MDISNVIILAGGRGTRLPASARDIPKSLVEVHGKPILAHQLERLERAGFHRVRLALGFRADSVIAFLKERGLRSEYVVEPEPLGTGGAVKFASRGFTAPFLVLNGDILADFDFQAIRRSHAPGTALLVSHWRDDTRGFGLLRLEGQEWIREFLEKPAAPQAGYINTGCYVLDPEDIHPIPHRVFMLEQELFPKLAAEGRLKTHIHRGSWEDLGTEERLARVRNIYVQTHE